MAYPGQARQEQFFVKLFPGKKVQIVGYPVPQAESQSGRY